MKKTISEISNDSKSQKRYINRHSDSSVNRQNRDLIYQTHGLVDSHELLTYSNNSEVLEYFSPQFSLSNLPLDIPFNFKQVYNRSNSQEKGIKLYTKVPFSQDSLLSSGISNDSLHQSLIDDFAEIQEQFKEKQIGDLKSQAITKKVSIFLPKKKILLKNDKNLSFNGQLLKKSSSLKPITVDLISQDDQYLEQQISYQSDSLLLNLFNRSYLEKYDYVHKDSLKISENKRIIQTISETSMIRLHQRFKKENKQRQKRKTPNKRPLSPVIMSEIASKANYLERNLLERINTRLLKMNLQIMSLKVPHKIKEELYLTEPDLSNSLSFSFPITYLKQQIVKIEELEKTNINSFESNSIYSQRKQKQFKKIPPYTKRQLIVIKDKDLRKKRQYL